MRFYEVPDTLYAEQDQFDRDIKEYVEGRINPVKFKAIRVAHGVYEQRQEHTYMVRIRCAAGGITPTQLKKVSEVGDVYGSGEVHFTTRQEVQVHDVLVNGVIKVIRGLNDVGLSSRGGGGNTVRNILTSIDSGISSTEVFDVEPYAIALTTRMIDEPDSWNLPRKLKISMSNGPDDTTYTQSTCLGFVATVKDGVKGFQVFCSGGMGAKPMVGHALLDFVPDTHVYHVTKALKVMFDKNGNRRSKYSSRIKFLWKKVGEDEFKRIFHEEYDQIKNDRSLDLVLESIDNSAKSTDLAVQSVDTAEFELWKKRYVTAQKQEGLSSIKIPLELGDVLRADANSLCDFLLNFGENTMRCERDQNIRLRNIPTEYLGNAYNVITGLKKSLVKHAPFIGNMINCTGASTCKLGICLPRGLSSAIRDQLTGTDLDLDIIPDFRLNMSGCPNTCGMHHVANLGFFGKVGRKDGDMYPAYNILAGGKVEKAGEMKYAQRVDEIASHRIPEFVNAFLKVWIEKKKAGTYADYNTFLEEEGNTLIKTLCDSYRDVPTYEADAGFYTDFGAKRRLSMDELGTAECSAGMFDMIEVDKKQIKKARKVLDAGSDEERPDAIQKILFSASRMLLVTRGLDAKTDEQVYDLFGKHFMTAGLIDEKFRPLLALGKAADVSAIFAQEPAVLALTSEVEALYKNMDDSLRFKATDGKVIKEREGYELDSEVEAEPVAKTIQMFEKDYRGVGCPMNFVKTKLVLETMESGDQLKILLDDGEPIKNVPGSVKLEGHAVLLQEQVGPHWEVLIQKK
ncbi:hypothetical protein HOH87_06620 [bacterium]|nr:hypothetical protein [bacterium]